MSLFTNFFFTYLQLAFIFVVVKENVLLEEENKLSTFEKMIASKGFWAFVFFF